MENKRGINKQAGILIGILLLILLSVVIYAQTQGELEQELAQLEQELADSGYSWLINYSGELPYVGGECYDNETKILTLEEVDCNDVNIEFVEMDGKMEKIDNNKLINNEEISNKENEKLINDGKIVKINEADVNKIVDKFLISNNLINNDNVDLIVNDNELTNNDKNDESYNKKNAEIDKTEINNYNKLNENEFDETQVGGNELNDNDDLGRRELKENNENSEVGVSNNEEKLGDNKLIVENENNIYRISEEGNLINNDNELVGFVMMTESNESNNFIVIVNFKNKDKTFENMDSSLASEIVPQRFVTYGISKNFSNLSFENFSQNRVFLTRFINLLLARGFNFENVNHCDYELNISETDLGLIDSSFLASSNSLMNESLRGNSSTGCQSILSQNSQSSSVTSPVCLYLSNMSRFINLTTDSAKNFNSIFVCSFGRSINLGITKGITNGYKNLSVIKEKKCYKQKWKLFSDLNGNEKVATLNSETGELEWQLPTERQEFEHDGEMYRIVTEKGELVVSPEHKVYIKIKNRKLEIVLFFLFVFTIASIFGIKAGEEKRINKLKKNKRITEDEIVELIKQKESDTVEFKQSIKRVREITRTLSGFANNKGGIVIVGVDDKKENINERIVGVDIGYQDIENLINAITENTEPRLYPLIKSFRVHERDIVLIYVKESDNKPISAFKRFFKRVGNVTKQLDREEYEKLMLERRNIGFDELVNKETDMNDIDFEKVRDYMKKRAELKGIKEPEIKPSKILRSLGIFSKVDGKLFLKNVGVLFFAKEPSKFILHNEVKLARFKRNSMTEFIDRVELKDSLPEMIEQAENFIKRNTRRATKVIEFKQENIDEYPVEAIREAIVNAVMHRDYGIRGTAIRVMIFDNRIEIESPGKLPKGVTLRNLEGSHVLRNEKIANLLCDIGMVEKWGTGIRRMKNLMKGHGLKEPVFEERDDFFRVIFYGPGEKILELKTKEATNLKDLRLNNRQIEALRLMVNEGEEFTNKRYREMFGVSERTALREMLDLVNKKKINQKGRFKDKIYFFDGGYLENLAGKMADKSENDDPKNDTVKTKSVAYRVDDRKVNEIKIVFKDGSVFSIKDDNISALKMKLQAHDVSIEEFKDIFIKKVEKHWKNRTVPCKWPWYFSWEEELKDDIWHRLYYELSDWQAKRVKKKFGYPVSSLTPVKWFDRDVKEENYKLIRDGVALKDRKLKIRNDTEDAKIYWEISRQYGEFLKKEVEKEFERRKNEAKNKYKNLAYLAKQVFYYEVRAYLFGIILGRASGGKSGSIVTSENDSGFSMSLVKENMMVNKKFKKDRKEVRFIKRIKDNVEKKSKETKVKAKKAGSFNLFLILGIGLLVLSLVSAGMFIESKEISDFNLEKISDIYSEIEQGEINVNDLYFLDGNGKEVRVESIEKVLYSGKIYDVDVPNDIVLVERDGLAVWSGNSNNETYSQDVFDLNINGTRIPYDIYLKKKRIDEIRRLLG